MRGTTTHLMTARPVSAGASGGRDGLAQFAAPAPLYTPPLHGTPTSATRATGGPRHRTAIIGATGVVLIAACLGGVAYLRAQDAATPTVVAAAPVVALAHVPHAALAALESDVVRAAGPEAVQVPRAAARALNADR